MYPLPKIVHAGQNNVRNDVPIDTDVGISLLTSILQTINPFFSFKLGSLLTAGRLLPLTRPLLAVAQSPLTSPFRALLPSPSSPLPRLSNSDCVALTFSAHLPGLNRRIFF